LRQGVEIGLELLEIYAVISGEPLERGLRLSERAIELGAIAGRKNCRFLDRFALYQLREGGSQALGVERHALANRQRRGLVGQNQREELHGEESAGKLLL